MPATLPAATSPSINLSASDRERLYVYVHRGHSSARTRTRAQAVLTLGEGWSDVAVCQVFDYTPKHGSWLNLAEIEISVFERGCLSRHVPDASTLEQRVSALAAERNDRRATIKWQFTNPQARVKLKKLYPVVQARVD